METIEKIKENLVDKLAVLWQKDRNEIMQMINDEPLLTLIVEALQYQYETVYEEVTNYKKNILLDLGKRLIPDANFYASPSRGVLLVNPDRKRKIFKKRLKLNKSFHTQIMRNKENIDISFIPVVESEIIAGEIIAIANSNNLIELKDYQIVNTRRIQTDEIQDNERYVWIGIDLEKSLLPRLNKLSFFVDYDVSKAENRFYFNELINAKWTFNNYDCEIKNGLGEVFINANYFKNDDLLLNARKNTLSYFSNNFISLSWNENPQNNSNDNKLPLFIKSLNANVSCWISIKCNGFFPIDFFMNNKIYINAIPVINCEIKFDKLTKDEPVKDFELRNNEFFFGLNNDIPNDEFIVNTGRFKTFDSKNLYQTLVTLLKQYDQHRIRFEDNNIIDEADIKIFRQLSNIIFDMKEKIKENKSHLSLEHISAKKEIKRQLSYSYLTTFGEIGNGDYFNNDFKYDEPGIDSKEIKALTNFSLGRNPPADDEIISRARYLILSKDRIVTKEDIKALSFLIFGEKNISDISISNTLVNGLGNKGLHRAINVKIRLREESNLSKEALFCLKQELLGQLENKSFYNMPFIINIEKPHPVF